MAQAGSISLMSASCAVSMPSAMVVCLVRDIADSEAISTLLSFKMVETLLDFGNALFYGLVHVVRSFQNSAVLPL